jgi:hypothetical protein
MSTKRNGACRITFQPSSTSTYPIRWLLDAGKQFNPSKGFGWSKNTSSLFRDRRCDNGYHNKINQIATNDIDACIVHFEPGTTWRIELGAGEWNVTIRVGDPTYPSFISLDANHQEHRLTGLKLAANEFYDWKFTTTKGTTTIFLETTASHTEHKRNWSRMVSFQAERKYKGVAEKGATLYKNSLRTKTSAAEAPKGTGIVQRDWVRDIKIEEKQARWRARVLRLKYCWKRAGTKSRNIALVHNLLLSKASSSTSSSSSSSTTALFSSKPAPEEIKIQEVCSMGFARNHAVRALSEKYNSVQHAIEWLLNNMHTLPPPDNSGNGNGNGSSKSDSNSNKNTHGYGTGLDAKSIGRRRAKKQAHPIITGRAEAISGKRYDAVQAREGMKHHEDNASLIQILPDQLLRVGTMMIQTHSREATQNIEERHQLDSGMCALAFKVERAAEVYIAIDHRLAEAETLPSWLLDDRYQPVANDVISVAHSEIDFFVMFVRHIPGAEIVELGHSGALGDYLPYFVYVTDSTTCDLNT